MENYIEIINSQGFLIKNYLNTPLTKDQIITQCQKLPFSLPDEIIELYEWHNGVKEECEIPLFRDNQFISLETALEEYDSINLYYNIPGVEHCVNLKKCFPFAAYMGSYYVLSTEKHSQPTELINPIINVFEGVDIAFLNLETMIKTCMAWYQEGVRNVHNPSVNYDREIEVWKRLNPDILSC